MPWSSVARPTGIMTQEAAPTQGSDGLDTLNGAILLMIEKTRVRSGAGLLALLIFAPASMAATYQYSADTTAPARRQGMVSVSGINWNCQGSRCTTSGPWATPAVGACRALAQQVGPVRGYGRKGRVLTAGELQQCNAGLPTSQPSGPSTTFTRGPQPVAPPPGTPATKPPGTPSSVRPSPGPVVINAGTLRYTGRGPVVINASPLRYVGRGPVVINASPLRYAGRGPVVINASPLRYVGQGPVVINASTLRYIGRGPVVINANTLKYSGNTR